MKRFLLYITFSFFAITILHAQSDGNSKNSSFFIQPEILLGKTIPANSNFPKTEIQRIFSLSFGNFVQDTSRTWSVFYNYPSVGVSVSYTNFGDNEVFGNAYSLVPFISISTSKKQYGNFYFKLGLGASYFTTYFNEESNPNNIAIGSAITWTFESTIHYNVFVTPITSLSIGGGFIHHSNGHTQLPNAGLNSVLFSVASRFYLKPLTDQQLNGIEKPTKK